MSDGTAISLIFVGIIAFVVAVVAACLQLIDKPNCKIMGDTMGYESYWSVRTSCMIKVNGKLIPLKSYRVLK